MNEQSPKAQLKTFDGLYHVHSIFSTIQGEGPFSGDAAIFIRLRDCNLQCPACDTEYTQGGSDMPATEIVSTVGELVAGTQTTLVVITGGEPFRQDLAELVEQLMMAGYRVQIETNGTLAPSAAFKTLFHDAFGVAIVVSPKARYVDGWIMRHAIAYKYVLTDGFIDPVDGLPTQVLGRASNGIARPPLRIAHVYVQPADMHDAEFDARNIATTIESCKKFGHRMQVQMHKYIGVE